MFTGLVEELGEAQKIEKGPRSARLSIRARGILEGTCQGDSIAVNGVCLTALDITPNGFTAQVMAETLVRTNLGELRPGSPVNLERAMRLGDRLGGHLVSGHIDGVGRLAGLERQDIARLLTIEAPPEVLRYLVPKGSVGVDGISLTVVEVGEKNFSVSLIPHTMEVTTLGQKGVGDTVNLEADLLAKYVERLLGARLPGAGAEGRLNMDFLAEHGFL